MRRLPGIVLATLLLAAGCGDDDADPGAGSSAPALDGIDFTQVAVLSATGAGGRTGPAEVLDDAAAVGRFADRLGGGPLSADVRGAVGATDVPQGQVLAAAVVAVGCDPAPSVASVTREGGRLRIVPTAVEQPLEECFAPVTSVAVVLVDETVARGTS